MIEGPKSRSGQEVNKSMRHFKKVIAALVGLALVASCSSSPSTEDTSGSGTTVTTSAGGGDTGSTTTQPADSANYAEDGTFTIAVAGDPGTLNALNNTSTTSNWLFRFLYDQLVTRGQDGEILSGLATDWEFDGTTAVFNIDENATCFDGSPVTPTVIAKNFEYIANPDNPSAVIGAVLPNRNFTVEADDDAGTFTLKLDSPFSLLLSSLSFMNIICGPGIDNPEGLTTTSSGSGPFVLESAVPNSEYVLARRDGDYTWGTGGATIDVAGFPARVVFKIVDNETTAANLLAAHQINAAVVNGPDQARLEAMGATEQVYVSGGVVQMYSQVEGKPTADVNVRRALAMAYDRGAAATAITQGILPDAGTSVSAANPQVCDDSAAASSIPEFDPDGAATLLDEAGWTAGDDGVRAKDGVRLSLDAIYSTATPGADATVELMAAAWEAIGFEINITPLAQGDYAQRVFATGDYDIVTSQFSNPFPSTLVGLLGGPFPPDGTNAAHITNDEYVSLFQQALASGENSGCEYWTQASAALFEHVDMIPIADWPTTWVLVGGEMDTLGGRPIPTSVRVLSE